MQIHSEFAWNDSNRFCYFSLVLFAIVISYSVGGFMRINSGCVWATQATLLLCFIPQVLCGRKFNLAAFDRCLGEELFQRSVLPTSTYYVASQDFDCSVEDIMWLATVISVHKERSLLYWPKCK